MEGSNIWSSVTPWIMILSVGTVITVINAGIQWKTNSEDFKSKAAIRDGLLGSIFTAMIWVLVPDTMQSLVSAIPSASSTTESVVKLAAPLGRQRGLSEFDLQVGPPMF